MNFLNSLYNIKKEQKMIIKPDNIEPTLVFKKSGKPIIGCFLNVKATLESGEILENYIDYIDTDSKIISAYNLNDNKNIKCAEKYFNISFEPKLYSSYKTIEIYYNDILINPDNIDREIFEIHNS